MKSLKEIRITNQTKIDIENSASFCIESLFIRLLGHRLITDKTHTVNIYLVENEAEHLHYYDIDNGFISINYYLKGDTYPIASSYGQKKILLDVIFKSLDTLANEKGWDKKNILDTYNLCLQLELKNEWWFKNKTISSPDRKHYIGIYNLLDVNDFRRFLVLFDKHKKEIVRHLIFADKIYGFHLEKLGWVDKNTIVYKFKGPKKIFRYTIDDLINLQVDKLPSKIHLLFK